MTNYFSFQQFFRLKSEEFFLYRNPWTVLLLSRLPSSTVSHVEEKQQAFPVSVDTFCLRLFYGQPADTHLPFLLDAIQHCNRILLSVVTI